jgi:hypothetical protein
LRAITPEKDDLYIGVLTPLSATATVPCSGLGGVQDNPYQKALKN